MAEKLIQTNCYELLDRLNYCERLVQELRSHGFTFPGEFETRLNSLVFDVKHTIHWNEVIDQWEELRYLNNSSQNDQR